MPPILKIDANDQHIVKIVDWLLQYAFDQRASDIHLEPRRDKATCVFSIDGIFAYGLSNADWDYDRGSGSDKILARLNVAENVNRKTDG